MKNKSKGKILVVDDEKEILNIIKTVLTESGYEIITAGEGIQALKIYKKQGKEIDLILSDIQMPKMGGIEFLREIKKLDKDIPPLYFCTTLFDDDKIKNLLDQGVSGIIQKPYGLNKLRETVDSAIAKYKNTPTNQTE